MGKGKSVGRFGRALVPANAGRGGVVYHRSLWLLLLIIVVAVPLLVLYGTSREHGGPVQPAKSDVATMSQPAAVSGADEIARRRKELWTHLAKAAGKIPAAPSAATQQLKTWYPCLETYAAAGSDRAKLYSLLVDHLVFAESEIKGIDANRRRLGLGVACEATKCALTRLKDKFLAVALSDVYLLPNVELADRRNSQPLSREDVIGLACRVYCETGQTVKYMDACRLRVRYADNPNSADAARYTLASLLEKQGRDKEALEQLELITQKDRNITIHRAIVELQRKMTVRPESEAKKPSGGQPR